MPEIFHLSLSVSDLNASRQFYEKMCGGTAGRIRNGWLDIWLFGAQITLYRRPAAIIPRHIALVNILEQLFQCLLGRR